jgi:nitrate/nitrite transporter NarK
MLLGRFIFGIGGDSFFVGKSAIISSWFKGNEVAFAFGLTLSIGRVGAVLNGLVVPKVTLTLGVPYALYLGFGACLVSAVGTICLVLLDLWAEKKDHLTKVGV